MSGCFRSGKESIISTHRGTAATDLGSTALTLSTVGSLAPSFVVFGLVLRPADPPVAGAPVQAVHWNLSTEAP